MRWAITNASFVTIRSNILFKVYSFRGTENRWRGRLRRQRPPKSKTSPEFIKTSSTSLGIFDHCRLRNHQLLHPIQCVLLQRHWEQVKKMDKQKQENVTRIYHKLFNKLRNSQCQLLQILSSMCSLRSIKNKFKGTDKAPKGHHTANTSPEFIKKQFNELRSFSMPAS